jgi:hypothetical protein
MRFIESSGVQIALKCPEPESGGSLLLRMLDQRPSYASSGCGRVDVELIDPPLVQDHYGCRMLAAAGDPNLAGWEHDLLEPMVYFLIGMERWRDRGDRRCTGTKPERSE